MTSELSALPVRTLSAADVDEVLDLARLCDIAEIGEPDTDREDVLERLDRPDTAAFGVAGHDGLDAYAWVQKRRGNAALHADVLVRPGRDPSAGPALLAMVRRAGRGLDPVKPLHAFVHTDDAKKREWFASAGGVCVRHFWRMVGDLGERQPEPALPAGARIRPVADQDADLRVVADVVRTSFQDHFGHERDERPSFEQFVSTTHTQAGYDIGLWWVATVEGEPAAALIGRQFDDIGFVNTLGTLAEFRGRGLGRALLLTAFAEFRRRGLRRSVLGVDASNPTGAVRLYESVGMRAEHAWGVWEVTSLPG